MIHVNLYIKNLALKKKLPSVFLIIDEGNKYHYLINSLICWLLCINKKKFDVCNYCTSCVLFVKKIHPDYHEIYSKNTLLKIDDIRLILNQLHYKPIVSENKIILIYPINVATYQALNAMLKVLEEPPKNTIFFLISTSLYILSTVKTRCQILDFKTEFKIKSYNIIKILYKYIIFNTTKDLTQFLFHIQKYDDKIVLDSIYIFLLHLIKKIKIKKKFFNIIYIDNIKILDIIKSIILQKCLITDKFYFKNTYFIESILRKIKDLIFFSIKNN